MPNVLNGIELDFTSCLPASSARACSSVLSLFILLHLRCVSLQFAKLYGSPPRETGMSSSTSALIGCGVFNVLSTGLPQMAHTSYAARTLALSCLRRQPLLTRSLRRLLMWPPRMYEPRGAVDLPTTIFAVGLLECRYRGSRIWTLPCLVGAPHHLRMPLPDCQYPYPGFVSWVPSAGFEPASTRGHKEANPIKTCGRYDLPLIPTKAYGQADLSITASRKHGIGLPATLRYVHSDGSGRSVSDMPFGQDGTATQVNQENPLEDISEGPNRVYRFGPSNPLTIVRCTFDFVKSNRVAAPADARPKACTMAVPYRSHRPAEACHAYATSESCSHCTGTRIRAAAPRTPPP